MMRLDRLCFSCLLVFLVVSSKGQGKKFTKAELFEGKYPDIFQPVPNILGWENDTHYLLRDERGQVVSVEVTSGKTHPFSGWETDPKGRVHSSGTYINPTSSPDRKWIAYTKKDHNLYLTNEETGKEIALTHDGSETILNGYASWLYYEEILGRSSKYRAFWWSDDSKKICYMRFDDSKVPVASLYVPDGQHGYLENRHYPQPGDPNPVVKIGIVSVDSLQTVWADFDPAVDQYFGMPLWTPSNKLWIPWMNREQDTLIEYEIAAGGEKKQVYFEHQNTWIDLDEVPGNFFPFENGQGYIVRSDKDGWYNLYLFDAKHQLVNQITTGKFWETELVWMDEKKKQLAIKARKDNSTQFDIYRVDFTGKRLEKLSSGDHSYNEVWFSPDGKYFIASYSSVNEAPVVALFNNKGKLIRELGNSTTPAAAAYFIPKGVFTSVKSSDGAFDLPMMIKYPYGFDSTKKYPVLVSVYGGPNSSEVMNKWAAPNPLLQWFSQDGVILVTMDSRSAGHAGKKGENAVFKQLGKLETEDFMSGGRWLRMQPWVDSNKIAITGGSFGGYITCMALTYGAKVFTHGISNFPVTDWSLYDSHYTERYMNKPKDNPQGYQATSVMSYVDQLVGKLRLAHGFADDNVHFQNTLQLVDKLQDRQKQFELMVYPGQRHGLHDLKAQHATEATIEFVERELLGKAKN